MQEKIDEYRAFKIQSIWVIDPVNRIGWDCSDGNWTRKDRFEVSGTPIRLDMHELFSELDASEA